MFGRFAHFSVFIADRADVPPHPKHHSRDDHGPFVSLERVDGIDLIEVGPVRDSVPHALSPMTVR